MRMRRYDKNIDNREVNITIYTSHERGADGICDVRLWYEHDHLIRAVFAPLWENAGTIIVNNKAEFDRLKIVLGELDEFFNVTGYKSFE